MSNLLSFRSVAMRRALLSSAALTGCLIGAPAFAQTAQGGSVGVEEIVVTARRQAENLQEIPLAVTAFTGETLRSNNVVNLQSLNGLTPSLNYQFSGSRASTGRVFFRGLTTGAGGQTTRASIFADGAYIAGSAQNIPFNYFERVEALPGPQSAQFGRATFGGAINYVTKGPTAEVTAVIHADYATDGDKLIDGFVAGPLFESVTGGKLLGSAFASYTEYEGPEEWTTPPDILHPKGIRQGAQQETFVAGKLQFDATENLTFRIGATYAEFHDQPSTFFLTPPGPLKNGAFQRYTSNDLTRPIPGVFLNYPVGSLAYGNDFTGGGIGIVQNFYNIPDPRIHDYNTRVNGQVEWNVLGHDVALNLAHESERNRTGGSDGDNTYFPASTTLGIRNAIKADQVELRISSDQEKRLRYTVGAYYLNFEVATAFTSYQHFRCTNTVVGCTTTNPAALFNPQLVNGALVGFTGSAILVNTLTPNSTVTETTDMAVFGMLAFDITDKLTVSIEARQQSEELLSRNLISGFRGEETFRAFVPRYNIQYRITDDIQIFGVYSVGNNPGGFNPLVASFIGQGATADNLVFEEERLKNYELGIKSKLFDGRVTANATIYRMDWVDQVANETRASTTGQLFTFQANRGTSRVQGGEIQISAVPIENLTLNATVSYNDAKYVDYCSASAVNITGYSTPGRLNCVVVNGNYLENVPDVTASLSGDYRWSVREGWEAYVGGAYRYRAGQWESDLNLGKSASQNIVDLRIGVEGERVNVSLFCSNCTDERATDRATNLADVRLGPGTTSNRTVSFAPRRPRQFGIRTAFTY